MEESGIVSLNVGGTPFDTTLDTLTKYPESMLGTMFAERNRHTFKPGKDGRIFLDRDPVCFGVLLEFLRCGELHVPMDVYPSKMRTELGYWGFDADELRKKVRCENVAGELAETSEKYLRESLGELAEDLVAYHRDDWKVLASNGKTEIEVVMVHLQDCDDSVRFLSMGYDRCREEIYRLLFPPNGRHPTLRPNGDWYDFSRAAMLRRIYEKLESGTMQDFPAGIRRRLTGMNLQRYDETKGRYDESKAGWLFALGKSYKEADRSTFPADCTEESEFFLLLHVCGSEFFFPECHACETSFGERMRKIVHLMRDKSALFSMERPREVFAEILEERMGFRCRWHQYRKYDINKMKDDLYCIVNVDILCNTIPHDQAQQKDVWSLKISWAPKEKPEASSGPKNKKRKKM